MLIMKNKRVVAAIVLASMAHGLMLGQTQQEVADAVREAIVKVNSGNKVIQVDKLNLPASTPIKDVLAYLPELVNRKTQYIASNYDIQVDGSSVGDARDATISMLHIADVKAIVVTENSLNSLTSFGQGGVINIMLKDAKEELTGSAVVDGAYVHDYVGGLLLSKKTGKWELKAIGNVEYYKPEDMITENVGMESVVRSSAYRERFFSETASLHAMYKASEHDTFKFRFSNVVLNQKDDYYEDGKKGMQWTSGSQIKTYNINTWAEYSHRFQNNSLFTMNMNYSYVPQSVVNDDEVVLFGLINGYVVDYNTKAHNIMGQLIYNMPLIKQTKSHALSLITGLVNSYRTSSNVADLRKGEVSNMTPTLDTNEYNYFLRPYVQLTGQLHSLSFTGMVDFQHYNYRVGKGHLPEFHANQDDFTGMASALWTINKRHSIRLLYNHSIIRPSGSQLFPYRVIDGSGKFVIGKADLRPTKSDNIDLDYVLNLSGRDYTLTFNVGGDYTHAHDVLGPYTYERYGDKYTSFRNRGSFNIFRSDLMAYFSKGIFSVSLTSNLYFGRDAEGDGENDFNHFNISFTPSLNFKSGWMGSASLYYNSKIQNVYYEQGDLCYANFRVGKNWKQWNVHLFSLVNLNDRGRDVYYDGRGEVIAQKNYDFMKYEVGAGVRYRF